MTRMLIPQGVYPRLIHTGRRDWPAGVSRLSPWLRPRVLKNHELWIVTRGKLRLRIDGQPLKAAAGQIIWFEPCREYDVEQDPEHPLSITFQVLGFHDESGRSVEIEMPPAGPIDYLEVNLAEAISRRILELLWEGYHDALSTGKEWLGRSEIPQPFFTDESEMIRQSPFCPLLINIFAPRDMRQLPLMQITQCLFEGFIREVFYELERQQRGRVSGLEKHHRDLVASVALRMQQNPRDIASVGDVAFKAGYSTDHFTRTFKKIMGVNPQLFLVNARLSKAKSILLDSGLTIKEIADQLGYCNAYFFSRQFKKITGYTPSEFRRHFARSEDERAEAHNALSLAHKG